MTWETKTKYKYNIFNMSIHIHINFRLKVSSETILRRFISKLFHNLGPPYANDRLPYATMLGIG